MKLCYKFLILAVSAFALFSCQANEAIPNDEASIHEYSFVINSPDNATKATLNGNVVKWTSGDYAGVVIAKPAGGYSYSNSNTKSEIIPATETSPARIMVKSYGELEAGATVHCFFPFVSTQFTSPQVKLSINSSQTNSINEMPMASIPVTTSVALPDKTGTDVGEINMVMLGSIVRFNIYSSNSALCNETVQSITFTSDEDIAGSFSFDLSKVDYDNEETMAISATGSKSVSIALNKAVGTSDAPIVADMVIAPGSYTGVVKVVTDVSEYSYTISSAKIFDRAHMKPLNVDLAKGDRFIPVFFRKLDFENDDYSGTYLIVDETGKGIYQAHTAPDGGSVQGVTITNHQILKTDDLMTEAVFVTKEDDAYYMKTSDGLYVYMPNTTSSIDVTETKTSISIVYDESTGRMKVLSTTGTEGTAIQVKDANKIKFYTGSNSPVCLYLLDGTGVPVDPNKVSLRVSDNVTASTTKNVTIPIKCNKAWHASATSDFLEGGSLSIDGTAGDTYFVVPFKEANTDVKNAKVVEVTVSAGEGDYYVEKTIFVTQKSPAPKLAIDPTEINVASNATSASFVVTDSNFEWQIISVLVDGSANTNYSAAIDPQNANKVNVTFPVNEIANKNTSSKVIVVKIGDESVNKTVSCTINQAGKNNDTSDNTGISYSYEFTGKQIDGWSSFQLGGMNWTVSGTCGNGTNTYWGYDGTKGQQFGSGTNYYTSLKLALGYKAYCNSTTAFGVKKVVVYTSGASSIVATVQVKVDGVSMGDPVSITATNTAYTFQSTDLMSGDITIEFVNTSKKAIYVKKVEINK